MALEIDDRTPGQLKALGVSNDWKWVVGGDTEGLVRVWQKETGQLVRTLFCR